jgi:hypothetical protein
MLAGASCLDRGIEREQIGLISDVFDCIDALAMFSDQMAAALDQLLSQMARCIEVLTLRARQEITFTVTRGRGIICAGGKRGRATGEIRGAVPAFG